MIHPTSPNHPDIIALLETADTYYAALYPAESNHLLDIGDLEQPNVTFLTAREDHLLGIGAIVDQGDYSEIKRMFVTPKARGHQIGRKILNALLEKSPHKTIRLETGILQREAIKLYHSAGFYTIEAFYPYKSDPNSLFMEMKLS